MDVQRLGVKIFAAEPVSLTLDDFVPVFHTWIQKRAVENHLLVDIHDYSHIHRGPGILLVAYEGNFSMDLADGRLGLFYYRKHVSEGTPEQRVAAIVETAIQACTLLEQDPVLNGRIRFNRDEMLFVANDRLHAPNDSKTFNELEPVLSAGLKRAMGDANFTLSPGNADPKERFTVRALTTAARGRH